MQRKHILLASKAKDFSSSQVKICGYIKAKSCQYQCIGNHRQQYALQNCKTTDWYCY